MITQTYNLNLVPSENQVIVNASQYDEGSRRIEFVLYHGRDLFDINDYEQKNNVICNVRVLGTKADGTGYMYDCGFSHSKVFFDIQEQMTVLAGQHTAEIRIVDNEDNIIGSSNFIFQIEKAALKDDTVISETDIPLLQRIINNIDSINAVETMLYGGTTGQVLAKKSDADGDVEWANPGQGGSAVWGEISGILANQTDLQSELDAIEISINTLDNGVVHKTENEEIYGQKTFNDKVFVREFDGTKPAFLVVDLEENNVGLNSSGFYFNASAPLWSAEKALYFPELQEGDFKTIATTDQIPVQTSQLENNSGFITNAVDNLTNYRTSADQDIIDSGKATTAQINNLQSQIDLKENSSNKVTSLNASSTDIQYPSAKVVYDELNNKVDKVSGKGLSTNDFTNADKTKLDDIENGAEVNVIEDIKVDNVSLIPTNKSVNIDLSGKENISNKTTTLSSASTDTQYPSAKAVYNLVSGKQDVLVSGTNIKTINNTSLLGSGNIDIQGGSGTVDEHYSPTSDNAQSGKAVAEALNTVVPDTYNSLYDETVIFKRNSVAREDRYYLAYPPLNGTTLEITNKSNINIQIIGYVGTRLIEYTSAFVVNKTTQITIQDDLTQFGFRCLAAGNLNVLINGEAKATQNKRNQELYQAMYDNDITYIEQATTTSGEYIYFEYPPAVGTTLRFTNLSEKQVRIYGYAKSNNAEVLITSWLNPNISETTTITTELRAMAVRAGNGTQGIKVEIAGSNALSSIPLNNKKVMYFGDSITEDPARYRRNLNLYTGMVEVASYAVSGATLKNTNSTVMDGNPSQSNNNTVPNQVQKLLNLETKPEAPDIVIVSAGTNDTVTLSEAFSEAQYTDGAAAYPTFTDVSNCDLTTWSGTIRWIYEKIISVYPNAVIFFATPIQSVKVSYELMKHKRDLIVENCNRLSTPVIDAFNTSGIYARYETNGENGKYLFDGLHPNASGAIKLAKCYQIELLKDQYII